MVAVEISAGFTAPAVGRLTFGKAPVIAEIFGMVPVAAGTFGAEAPDEAAGRGIFGVMTVAVGTAGEDAAAPPDAVGTDGIAGDEAAFTAEAPRF